MTAIKIANTRDGFAIGLLSGSSYRDNKTFYEVVRINRDNKYVVLHQTRDITKAKALANREWAADR